MALFGGSDGMNMICGLGIFWLFIFHKLPQSQQNTECIFNTFKNIINLLHENLNHTLVWSGFVNIFNYKL
jgi:hypothetical protein